jgi:hypothetical protein
LERRGFDIHGVGHLGQRGVERLEEQRVEK